MRTDTVLHPHPSSKVFAVKLLSDVRVGESGVLHQVDLSEDVSDHLAHLGFLPGAEVVVLRRAPAGDPTVYRIDGVEVGLRRETAEHILIDTSPGAAGTLAAETPAAQPVAAATASTE